MQTSRTSISNTNQENSVENEAFWKLHFKQFKRSRLSKTAYARNHHLVLHRFMYWSRKFETMKPVTHSVDHQDFIPVQLPTKAARDTPPPQILCTLRLTNGQQLLIHDESALKTCLAVWG